MYVHALTWTQKQLHMYIRCDYVHIYAQKEQYNEEELTALDQYHQLVLHVWPWQQLVHYFLPDYEA